MLQSFTDLRWLWVYFDGGPQEALEESVMDFLRSKTSRFYFEGCGTAMETPQERDLGFVFEDANECLECAQEILWKVTSLTRAEVRSYLPDDRLKSHEKRLDKVHLVLVLNRDESRESKIEHIGDGVVRITMEEDTVQ